MPAPAPDLVVIGGVVADVTPSGLVPGGAAFYAARAAHALGYRVGVLTHQRQDIDVSAALVGSAVAFAGEWDVTFTNSYGPSGRVQRVEGAPHLLAIGGVSEAWQAARAVLLAPVYHEVPEPPASAFPNALLGVAPQGWMRQADMAGRVHRAPWSPTPALLRRAALVALSEEDLGRNLAAEQELTRQCKLLVVTRGARGCTVFQCGRAAEIAGFPATEVDPTGAGDVFAAAFLLRLTETGEAADAARFANAAASFAVEAPGVTGLPNRSQVLERMARHHTGERK